MTETAAPTEDPRAQRLAMLRELAEIGMELARDIGRQAKAPDAAERGDLGLMFSRIARAVRQTLALEARLEEEFSQRTRTQARAQAEQRARLVRRVVTQVIEAEAQDDDEADALAYELEERLSDRKDDENFLDRPIPDLIAAICKALGVTPDWTLWEDEDWAPPDPETPLLSPATQEGEDPGEGGAGLSPPTPASATYPQRCHPGMGEAHVRDP